jgi:hypothetical protein
VLDARTPQVTNAPLDGSISTKAPLALGDKQGTLTGAGAVAKVARRRECGIEQLRPRAEIHMRLSAFPYALKKPSIPFIGKM